MSENLEEQIESLKAENKLLRAKSSLLNSILENAPILISAKDLQGKILFVNEHFRVLEGPTPEEFIHKNVYDLFPADIADALWQKI